MYTVAAPAERAGSLFRAVAMAIIEASIPLFFILIFLEWWVARRRGDAVYRLNDSISDLSCGILSQLAGIFVSLLTVAVFAWSTTHLSLQRAGLLPEWVRRTPVGETAVPGAFGVDWPALASWTLAFLLVDLAYYVLHRCSHTVHVLWAGHVVHHSSEEYNLTVALRQSALHGLLSWVFFVPLAVDRDAVGALRELLRAEPRLPVLDPHPRDRPVAGVARMVAQHAVASSRAPRRESAVSGHQLRRRPDHLGPDVRDLRAGNRTGGLRDHHAAGKLESGACANVHVFADIMRNAWRTKQWRDKVRVVFGRPDFRPADLRDGGAKVVAWPAHAPAFDPAVPRAHQHYGVAQFIALLVAAYLTLVNARTLASHEVAAMLFFVTLGLANVGAVFEGRQAVRGMEFARLATMLVAAVSLLARGQHMMLAGAVAMFSAASALWFQRLVSHRATA